MKRYFGVFAVVVGLTACQGQDERIAFDGQYFRAKVQRLDGSYDRFNVSVKPVSASLEGAREAGRYEAVSYCIKNFGTSEIAWVSGPDSPAAAQVIQGDTLVYQGACPNR